MTLVQLLCKDVFFSVRVIGVSVIHFIVSSINIYHSFYCVLHHPTKPRILSLSLGSVSPPLICLDVDMAIHHCMCDIRTSYTQPTITIIANNTTLTAVRSLPSFSNSSLSCTMYGCLLTALTFPPTA